MQNCLAEAVTCWRVGNLQHKMNIAAVVVWGKMTVAIKLPLRWICAFQADFVKDCRWHFLYIWEKREYTYFHKKGIQKFKCNTERTACWNGRLSSAICGDSILFQEVPIDIINKIADCAPFIRGILFPTAIASLSFVVILTAAEVCHAVRFISGRYYELAADFFTHFPFRQTCIGRILILNCIHPALFSEAGDTIRDNGFHAVLNEPVFITVALYLLQCVPAAGL